MAGTNGLAACGPCKAAGVLVLGVLLLASHLHGAEQSAAGAPERPNVILIYADDLGWGDLGCYGHPRFKTPNLDRLASEGARLTNFYSSCPYCAPSRAALQTGRYQFRSGVTTNPFPRRKDDIGLPASEITLGEAFRGAGYHTICIGKWHLGHKPEFHPLRHGYDEYLGILYSNDMRPVELWEGEKVIEYPVYQPTLTRRYTERAIAFMEKHQREPFFIYLPHAAVHKPLNASEEFFGKTGAGIYGDNVAELDWGVGRIVARLRELGLDRKTLLLFSSDNGPWYGGSTGGLRGMKARTWEGGIRVPLIAWWPGRIPAGHVSHQPAATIDLFVTSLQAAGIPVPADRTIDGRDIMPLLTSDAPTPHDALFSLHGDEIHTVRSGKWKLHLRRPGPPNERVWKPGEPYHDANNADGLTIIAPCSQPHPSEWPGIMTGDPFNRVALFDMEKDPTEQHDVAPGHADVVRRLRKMAEDIRKN